ncbi:MAG: hypothetical protein KKF27_20810 [Gammaproteobacteria bacterium]|nr:hypothetical protein [Gammaproteobacteria bacterium]MBU2685691.1 hypothetical protein [Gammaproteobacteria bacterium]
MATTNKELGEKLDQLTGAMMALVEMQKKNLEAQGELRDLLKDQKQVRDELEAKMESPEIVRQRIEAERKVVVEHDDVEPVRISINGATWRIVKGTQEVPLSVAQAYECRQQDIAEADMRRERLKGLRPAPRAIQADVDSIVRSRR